MNVPELHGKIKNGNDKDNIYIIEKKITVGKIIFISSLGFSVQCLNLMTL